MKNTHIVIMNDEFGWSDLDSWGSLHSLLNQDGSGNATVGDNISLYNCKNCVVHTSEVIEGLYGYIVAEKGNRLLVCRLENEQMIKDFSAR